MAQDKNLNPNEEQRLNPNMDKEQSQQSSGRNQETQQDNEDLDENDEKVWGTGSDGGSAADGEAA